MIRRLFPHPVLSLLLILVWMMLVNRFAWGSLVFAVFLGIVIPAITGPYWPDRAMVSGLGKIIRYMLIVIKDIVTANIDVAKIVLFMPNRDLKPVWLRVPLRMTSPEGITMLASTITLTPGTVSADLSEDGRFLLVHCLHAPDPDSVLAEIKTRYEDRLLEIFH